MTHLTPTGPYLQLDLAVVASANSCLVNIIHLSTTPLVIFASIT